MVKHRHWVHSLNGTARQTHGNHRFHRYIKINNLNLNLNLTEIMSDDWFWNIASGMWFQNQWSNGKIWNNPSNTQFWNHVLGIFRKIPSSRYFWKPASDTTFQNQMSGTTFQNFSATRLFAKDCIWQVLPKLGRRRNFLCFILSAQWQLCDRWRRYFNYIYETSRKYLYCNVPPRAPGSGKTRGQGSFGPFTGGLTKRLYRAVYIR